MKQLRNNSPVWFHIPQVSAKPVLDNVSLQIGNKDCILFLNYFYLNYWHWWFSLSVLIFPSCFLVSGRHRTNKLTRLPCQWLHLSFCCFSFFVPLEILFLTQLFICWLVCLQQVPPLPSTAPCPSSVPCSLTPKQSKRWKVQVSTGGEDLLSAAGLTSWQWSKNSQASDLSFF